MKIGIIWLGKSYEHIRDIPTIRGALGASSGDPQDIKRTPSDVDRPQTNC
jgi:hypothetical protein